MTALTLQKDLYIKAMLALDERSEQINSILWEGLTESRIDDLRPGIKKAAKELGIDPSTYPDTVDLLDAASSQVRSDIKATKSDIQNCEKSSRLESSDLFVFKDAVPRDFQTSQIVAQNSIASMNDGHIDPQIIGFQSDLGPNEILAMTDGTFGFDYLM